MKTILKLTAGFGFFLLIGTAGAGDVDVFTMERMFFQVVISILLMSVGGMGAYCISEKERKKRRRVLKNI